MPVSDYDRHAPSPIQSLRMEPAKGKARRTLPGSLERNVGSKADFDNHTHKARPADLKSASAAMPAAQRLRLYV